MEWLPILDSYDLPDECIVGNYAHGKLWWAQAARRGKGPLRVCWYDLAGNSLGVPNIWMPLPPPPASTLEG
jgi:hypothetical protein